MLTIFGTIRFRDFFILPNFSQKQGAAGAISVDSRFRGIYFLLVNFLALNEAKLLERELINYSVDYSDHNLSDEFIRLLRSRSSVRGYMDKINPV